MNDCGGCKFCLDKRKFGGPGKLKKRCELRVCMTPRKMGAPSPKPMMTSSTTPITNGHKLPLEVRSKFLTTIENRQNNKVVVENQPMQAENRIALENIIEMGLETYEVVNVNGSLSGGVQVVNVVPQQQLNTIRLEGQKLCYICKRDNKEDLFYCSSCCDPFHQFCLHMALGTAGSSSISTTCARCKGGKGDYEQAMNARADSIHAKCEEIDGAQYQVISFLTDAEHLKMPEMILQVEEEEEEEAPLPNQNTVYDNDFDAYLHTISLAE